MWTQLAAEAVDRCYHSTAVLLPDGRVLSAGGGEFFPVEAIKQENDPADTHRNAQIFSPPYLFKGARPVVTSAPASVGFGEVFHVVTPQRADVRKVSWIRLSSVTHSFNTGQRFNSLAFAVVGDGLDITAPASPNACPPGHYMLFLLNQQGVPSVASIIRISGVASDHQSLLGPAELLTVSVPRPGEARAMDAFALRAAVLQAATGTRVVVGITGTCPYGIAACWGGANEALHELERVEYVDPIPDGQSSTATVFLTDRGLPPIGRWGDQFHRVVNDSYVIRGYEVTVTGRLEQVDEELRLASEEVRSPVRLTPLGRFDKVQWDRAKREPQPPTVDELEAYGALASRAGTGFAGEVTITGPLTQTDVGYQLGVRQARSASPSASTPPSRRTTQAEAPLG
jgi:hypothetical protein